MSSFEYHSILFKQLSTSSHLLRNGISWFTETFIDHVTNKVKNLPTVASAVYKKVDAAVDAQEKMAQYN